jgi:hypothetical protein
MKNPTGVVLSPALKCLLFVITVPHAIGGLYWINDSFHEPDIYKKDFVSEYVMAKAILNGVNPYTPLPRLAEQWVGDSGITQLNHPTPHPPMVGIVSLPLGLLSYKTSALVWLFLELISILASICLIFYWWGIQLKPGIVLITFLSALGWTPVIQDLWYGQLNTYLLLLLVCAWLALREGKDTAGGAILGGMIALKLAAWPLMLFLAYRRRWRGVLAAAAVTLMGQLIAISVLGLTVVKDYYLKVGPAVSSFYNTYEYNISLWTLGNRLFSEYGQKCITMPLWPSPFLAHLLTYAVPGVFLITGLALAVKAKQFDTSLGILVIVGWEINPVAWIHYFLLATVPIVIIARRIILMDAPRKMAYTTFVICLVMSISPGVCISVAKSFSTQTTPEGFAIVPLWAGSLILIPVMAALGLIILLWKTDGYYGNLPRFADLAAASWLRDRVPTETRQP